MSNYNNLKSTINANIKTNGNEEITGFILNSVLNEMVTALGAGYQLMGVANQSTSPGTPDTKVFYFAPHGTYPLFGVTIPKGSIGIFRYDTSWHTDIIEIPIADDVFESLLNEVIRVLTSGGDGQISESDHPKTAIVLFAGNETWTDVSYAQTTRGELIPLSNGVQYKLTFTNGLGGYAVVKDSNPQAGQIVDWATGYSSLINTEQGDVVTIMGEYGQYLFVRADNDPAGRVFPTIETHSADPLVLLRSEVDYVPTQGSSGVASSGGLYTLFNTINTLLSSIAEVLPVQRTYPPGRYDVPMSGVSFINKTPGYYGGSYTQTDTTRAITNIISIPRGATRINASVATGYKAILYFLRNDGTWDSNVPASNGGSWDDSPSLDVPESFVSAGAVLYMRRDDGEDISTSEAKNAVSAFFYDVPETTFVPVSSKEMAQKTISILFIGNSLTQDAVSYVPWLIRNLYPNMSFKFYMWYNGGYTLAQHYTRMVNNQKCEIFSKCENEAGWSNYNNSVTMQDILTNYQFDIVCLQEYFNYKSSYVDADLVDFNNVVSYIRSNYARNFKVVSLFHAPKRGADVGDIFNLTKSGNELILQKTAAQSLIAPGVAIYRALSTDLNNLGDQGGLSPDGTHAQEGLPCLLQAWVVFMWIMRQVSVPISIENCQLKMTTAIYNTINVPGQNLGTGVVEGTQADNWLAQDVAILGDKEGIGMEQNAFITMYQ